MMPELYVTPQQVKSINDKLQRQIDALAKVIPIDSWSDVQNAVRHGVASKVFSIGDQLTCQRNGVNLVWDIIGIDHDTPADTQFTHSLTLQLHDCFPTTMQFDAPEAFYYCNSALAAGTYHFTVSGTDYQFEVTNDIDAGSQLMLGFTSDTPTSISVSASVGGTVSGSSMAVTAGSGGTALDTDYINDIGRARYGSNNYKESAIRQWLNSSAAAGSVWTPQNNFDRPPSWAGTATGFMNGMDADFLAVVGSVEKTTLKNDNSGGGSDNTVDPFFLLSRSEIYMRNESSNADEGATYPYYENYSDLASPGTGSDSNRIKYRNSAAEYWWCRTPHPQNGHYVRYVGRGGGLIYTGFVNIAYGIAPACNII